MLNSLLESAITTLVIALSIPLLGFTLGKLTFTITYMIHKHLGKNIASFFHNWLTFVGVIHHELSHALFAFITGAKILEINLFKPNGQTLGSIAFQPRGNKIMQSIQMTFASIAPVVTGLITNYILIFKVANNCDSFIERCIIMYLIISIFMHTTMSKQDIKSCLRGLPICTLIIFIIVLVLDINLLSFA